MSFKYLLLFSIFFLKLHCFSISLNLFQQKDGKVSEYLKMLRLIDQGYEYIQIDVDSAKHCVQKLQLISEFLKQDTGLYEAQMILSKICFRKEDFHGVIHHCKKALINAQHLQSKEALSKIYNNIGIAYLNIDKTALGIEYLNKALVIKKEMNNQLSMAYTLNNIGMAYMGIGDFDKSLDYYFQSLELKLKADSTINIGSSLSNIAAIYFETKDYDRAINYYSQALGQFYKSADHIESVSILIDLGLTYKEKGDFSKALEYYNTAFEIADRYNLSLSIAKIKMFKGSVFLAQKRYNKALNFYEEALEIFNDIDNMTGLVDVYYNLSKAKFATQEYEKSLFFLKKSNKIALKINARTDLLYNYKQFSDLYSATGEYENALKSYKIFVAYTDSIFSAKSNQTIERLKIEFDTEKKEQEIQILYQKQKLNKIQLSQQNWFILTLSLISLLLIVVMLLVVIRIRYVKKTSKVIRAKEHKIHQLETARLNNKIQVKSKELTANIMHLIEKNAVIQKTTQDLIRMKDKLQKQHQQEVSKIIIELKLNANQGLWEEFETRFKDVHQDFYANLVNKYPTLTPNELKLCAFLKLNMSTKDIAAITLKTTHSINVARTRLRKKLNITNTELNIVTFLTQI